MNLFFYSGGPPEGSESLDEQFAGTIGRRARVLFIPAAEAGGLEDYAIYCRQMKQFGVLKTDFFQIDRALNSGKKEHQLDADAIYLSGGNTFHFVAKLRKLGLIALLRRFARSGGTVAGLSAGSIMMTPTIALAGLVPDESDENTYNLKQLSGLSLVDFEVYPHFTGSPRSSRALRGYSNRNQRTIFALRDGGGIQITGETTTFHGKIECFSQGASLSLCPP